eukprot:2138149-Amphidinium_carterae.1
MIDLTGGTCHAVVFTDGAVEKGTCSIGGVLTVLSVGSREYFAAVLLEAVVQSWAEERVRHPVARTEKAATSVAMLLWAEKLKGIRCLAFIDNTAVVQALVKRQSSDEFMRRFIRAVSGVAVRLPSCVSYEQVSTGEPS